MIQFKMYSHFLLKFTH